MWIDVIFAAVAAFGFYWGYSRGIIRTVISVVAVLVGFVLAVRFSAEVTSILAQTFNASTTGAMPLIGFVVSFVLVLLLLRMLANALESVLSKLRINFINQAAGGFAAAIIATFLYSVLLLFVDSASLISQDAKVNSVSYTALEAFPEQGYAIIGKTKPALEKVKEAGEKAMDRGREERDAELY